MPRFYEKAIYDELGEGIGSELKENHCKIIINYENMTYTFSDCSDSLLGKIIEEKKLKGEGSILNEFRSDWIMPRLKWKMSEKDRMTLIKKFRGYETTFDLLISEQKMTYERLLKNL
jgi:hypothetical protein